MPASGVVAVVTRPRPSAHRLLCGLGPVQGVQRPRARTLRQVREGLARDAEGLGIRARRVAQSLRVGVDDDQEAIECQVVVGAEWKTVGGLIDAAETLRGNVSGLDEVLGVDVAEGAPRSVALQDMDAEAQLVGSFGDEARRACRELLEEDEGTVVGGELRGSGQGKRFVEERDDEDSLGVVVLADVAEADSAQ